jgi:hypothetical protein
MSIRDEVLEANDRYAASFGDKGQLAQPRPDSSPSSPVWTPASTPRPTPVFTRATPT